jgi:hypothetical protein
VQRGGHWVGLLVDSLLTDKLLFQLQTGVSYKDWLEDTLHKVNGTDRSTPESPAVDLATRPPTTSST